MKYCLFLFPLFCIFSLTAQQPLRVRELEKERMATLAEIEETNRLLKENTQTLSNALSRLNLLIQQVESRKKVIQLLNQEITTLDDEINEKEEQIALLEKDLVKKREYYAASIRKVYLQKKNQVYLLFILSSQNFTQSFHRMMYLKAYSTWQRKQVEEIISNQKTINQERDLLVTSRSDKLNLLNDRQSEENQLTKEEERKKNEVTALEKNKSALLDELAQKEKQANALNKQIERIIAEEVLKSEEKTETTENQEERVPEVKGGYAMTPRERTLSSSFADNRGKLPFPVTGNYKIVGYFGVHQHKELSKVVTNNNGIDIETTSGNEARAVFVGVVSRIFTLPGYNNSIIIRHGNYLTLYSNIDQVYVKQGDMVNTGQTLGVIYTDKEKGNSTLLHFEVWKEQTKLDPINWIK